MRDLSTELQEHLQSGATTMCHCWRIVRTDGVVGGFTDHDREIDFDGTSFEARSGMTASAAEAHLGLAIGGTEVSGALDSASLLEADLHNGLYDNARVEIWQVNWSDHSQRVLMDVAIIGEVRRSEFEFTTELRSLAHVLDQERGRLFQSACSADLGDQKCQVDTTVPAFQAAVSVVAATSQSDFEVDTTAFDTGWFSDGQAEFLTGENAGAKFTVRSFTSFSDRSKISLWTNLTSVPSNGDQVQLTAGCDKRFETCRSKFSNGSNFRGFPHIPGNDALLTHPGTSSGPMDGGSLYDQEA